jgi:Arc/MetJ-type ribon-helix-helix transcriptional regulator
MRNRVLKSAAERAVKKTVSMPPAILHWAEPQSRLDGFATFSDYIQHLIREDKDRRHANRAAA